MELVTDSGTVVGRRAYWDPTVYAQELDRVFKRCWLYVAHESEVAQPGDYVTRRMGADPVIVSRDEHGKVHVFANSCAHRGTQLCSADLGNASHFRCSYHGWTYANSGELRGVPEMREVYGDQFSKSDYRLLPAPRVESFLGLIFASWDADITPLDDYLADIKFYLGAMLGKASAGLEVIGPPTRGIVKTNWKIGAENYSGDGYHLSTTHKVPIDIGVFGTGRELEPAEDLGRAPSHCVDGGNGHTVRIQQLPMKFERPTFLGWPEDLWPDFEKNLTPQQADMMSGLAVMHGNLFPNLSFIESLIPDSGAGDTPPTSFIHLRQWQPLGPDKTELLMWCLVPKGTSAEWRRDSQRAFIRTLGFGGMFEVDDFQNWVSMAQAHAGEVVKDWTYDFKGGAQLTPSDDVDWPGKVYAVDHTETNAQAMYRRWQEYMS